MPASSSVFLNVADIGKAMEFYRGLGFRVDREHRDDDGRTTYADLSFQGAELGLGHIPGNDDPGFRSWVATPLGAGVVVYFTVPDVDRCDGAARRIGATIEVPMFERSYGRGFTLNDPDGYVVTFLEEPRRRPARRRAARPRRAKAARPRARRTAGRRKRRTR